MSFGVALPKACHECGADTLVEDIHVKDPSSLTFYYECAECGSRCDLGMVEEVEVRINIHREPSVDWGWDIDN